MSARKTPASARANHRGSSIVVGGGGGAGGNNRRPGGVATPRTLVMGELFVVCGSLTVTFQDSQFPACCTDAAIGQWGHEDGISGDSSGSIVWIDIGEQGVVQGRESGHGPLCVKA